MAIVSSRQGLVEYAKRELGFPVVQINVDDDQVSDRVDEAIQYYRDYHMDATEITYLKYQITQQDVDNRYIDITRASGVVSVTSGSANVYGRGTVFTEDMKNGRAVVTINGETKQVVSVANTTFMTVNTTFSASATDVNVYVPRTDDAIVSIQRIVTLGDATNRGNMFDVQYQFRLNELYDLVSVSYVNYYITMVHMRNLQMLFTGEKEMRYNRHGNRLYMDFNLGLVMGQYLMFEAYRALDPEAYTTIYNDRWLKEYTTALIKRQWGTNMKKFSGVALIGGVQMNGQEIYDEAEARVKELRQEIKDGLSYPPQFLVG